MGRPRRAAPRGAARSGGLGGRGGWGGGLGAREKVTPGRDRSDPRSEHRRRGCARRSRPAASGGGGCARARSPLRLRGKPREGGHRSAPRTPVPKVAAILRKSGFILGRGRLLCPGAGRRGHPAQRPGAGGVIAHVGWSWPRVDPPHAGGLGASCSSGRAGGRAQAPALEPQLQGR